jgi:hypothetical protein
VRERICRGCGKSSLEVPFNKNGHGGLRARCIGCEIPKRLYAKRIKLKGAKSIVTTHGGSSRSRQKVRP